MRGTWLRVTGVCGVVGLVAGTARATQDEDEVAVARVPAAAIKAVGRSVPGIRVSRAYKYDDDGKTLYEVHGLDPQNREVEVEVTPRGQVIQVETTIAMLQVPRVVLSALKAKTRGLKLTSAEVVTKGGRLAGYEFEGLNAEGDDVEVTVSPDGRTVTVDVDDDDDE